MYELLTVIGNVGKVTRSKGTSKYIKLSVAADSNVKNKSGVQKKTTWYGVTLWGDKQVDYYNDKVSAGDLVMAVGKPDYRIYETNGKSGLDISIKTDFGGSFRVLRRSAKNDDNEIPDIGEIAETP
jgi:single-stranded DNA-binding protein